MSTNGFSKGCRVYEDWQRLAAQHADLIQEKSNLEDEIHRYNNELSDALTEVERLKADREKLLDFAHQVGWMTQRAVTDNTTDEAEENGVAGQLRGFITNARLLEKEMDND